MMEITEKQLKYAIATNDINFLNKNLSKFNVNYSFKDESNDSLISFAISDAGSEAYKFFLKKNATLTQLNDEGEGIIHSAVFSGIVERVIEIIELGNFNINLQSFDGTTPLLLSISLEHFAISKYLVSIGADINLADEDGNLPIHTASQLGQLEIVKVLVEHGAALFAKTKYGHMPLSLAVNNNHIDVIKYLFLKMYTM